MQTATISQLKKELNTLSKEELLQTCLTLGKYKKENKELLSYLLFEQENETNYINNIKLEVDELFTQINTKSYFFIKKSVRKILRLIKKYAKYSKNKETETELLLYFCIKLANFTPSIQNNVTLVNIYERQIVLIEKNINAMHEDLQYDYQLELNNLERYL